MTKWNNYEARETIVQCDCLFAHDMLVTALNDIYVLEGGVVNTCGMAREQ